MFMNIDADLSQARRKVRDAFGKFHEDIDFTDDEVELLYREAAAAREMLGLFCAALTGDSGTDWDAALAELEYKRQYGPDGIEGDANS